MRRRNTSSFLACLLCFVLAGCNGTATDTENTLSVAHLEDGRPAAGAVFMVRTRDLVVAPQGFPAWKLVFALTADGQGRFPKVPLPQDGEIFLEIRQNPAHTPAPGHMSQVYFIRYDSSQARPAFLENATLSSSGALQGRLQSPPGAPLSNRWIGVPGSSVLVRLDSAMDASGTPFLLQGLYPGAFELSVVTVTDPEATQTSPRLPRGPKVIPDTVTDLGTLLQD